MLTTIRGMKAGALVMTLSVLLAACGGNGTSTTPTASPTTPSGDPGTPGGDPTDPDPTVTDEDIAAYFSGRTIEIVVGYDPGSSQDIEARLLGDHLTRLVPGNPTFTTSYQPGAAGMAAYEFIYRAPADGFTLAIPTATAPADQLLRPYLSDVTGPTLSFDLDELEWVGSTGSVPQAVWTHSDSGITSVEDLRGRETIAGATRVGSSTYVFMSLLRDVMDVSMEFILGYATGSDMSLALLRDEIELQGGNWSTFVLNAEGLDQGALIPLISLVADPPQADLDRLGIEAPPNIRDLTDDPDMHLLIDAAQLPQQWGRLLVAPPGTPAHIVNAIGDAIGQLGEDPEFIADREARGVGEITPLSGSTVASMIESYFATPPEMLERIAELLGG